MNSENPDARPSYDAAWQRVELSFKGKKLANILERLRSDSDLIETEAAFSTRKRDGLRDGQLEQFIEEIAVVQSIAADVIGQSQNFSIECKAGTCRIVGQFSSKEAAENWCLFYLSSRGTHILSCWKPYYVPRSGGRFELRVFATYAGSDSAVDGA